MTHSYELRKFNDDNSITTVLRIAAEPKYAKERARNYANENPGIYSLQRVERVGMYFTEKEGEKTL